MITHETRREAHEAIKPKIKGRKKLILDALYLLEADTAMGIAKELFLAGHIPYPIRNYVQPRLNELQKDGLVEVVGKSKDKTTGRTVAVYRRK